jgi:hypothetical protein
MYISFHITMIIYTWIDLRSRTLNGEYLVPIKVGLQDIEINSKSLIKK